MGSRVLKEGAIMETIGRSPEARVHLVHSGFWFVATLV